MLLRNIKIIPRIQLTTDDDFESMAIFTNERYMIVFCFSCYKAHTQWSDERAKEVYRNAQAFLFFFELTELRCVEWHQHSFVLWQSMLKFHVQTQLSNVKTHQSVLPYITVIKDLLPFKSASYIRFKHHGQLCHRAWWYHLWQGRCLTKFTAINLQFYIKDWIKR